jgi:hypothetical protein
MTGQSIKERQIEVYASAAINGTEYFIKINTNALTTKVEFKISDSISSKLENDKEFNSLRDSFLLLNYIDFRSDTVLNYMDKMKSIIKKHTFYSEDSIEIANSQYQYYIKCINALFNTPTDSLDNQIRNKNRIVLDGINMTFTLSDDCLKREIFTRTPSVNSHPLLYKFLTTSLNIFRDIRKKDFLNKRRLFGY